MPACVCRGDCTFEDKYDIVKASGAAGALLINTEHTLFPMPGTGRIPTRSLAPEATPDSQNGTQACLLGSTIVCIPLNDINSFAESGDDAIPFVMVQRTAAVELRKLLNTGSLSLGNVILDGNVRRLWDEVDSLLDHKVCAHVWCPFRS